MLGPLTTVRIGVKQLYMKITAATINAIFNSQDRLVITDCVASVTLDFAGIVTSVALESLAGVILDDNVARCAVNLVRPKERRRRFLEMSSSV